MRHLRRYIATAQADRHILAINNYEIAETGGTYLYTHSILVYIDCMDQLMYKCDRKTYHSYKQGFVLPLCLTYFNYPTLWIYNDARGNKHRSCVMIDENMKISLEKYYFTPF